jgi:D-alanyl-D-alanine carboxypeptidase (penicillin-binding protein 5/6)
VKRVAHIVFLIGLLAFPLSAAAGERDDPFPGAAASYLLKIDGKAVWGHRPDRRLPPASLTKIMTALLVLERGGLGEVATVGPAASRETGTRLGLKPGDRIRVAELLAATILGSANDAAHALADHVDGTEERFVKRMNDRAAALGMKNSRFANDIALLAEAALADERFARLVATVRLDVETADGGRTFRLENRNEMVGRYPGATGVKTGYTREAGPCLVVSAVRGGSRLLLVLLNAPNRWWDAVGMLDGAFSRSAAGSPIGRQ